MSSAERYASDSAQKAVKDMVAQHLIPIVVSKNGLPGPIGTGFPLDLGSRKVVVTAAHVIEGATEEAIHFAISGIPEGLASERLVHAFKSTPGDKDDQVDLAALELTEYAIDQLTRYRRWLPLSRLERDDNRTYDTHMVLVGCPTQLATSIEGLNLLAVQPMAFFTRTYSRGDYARSHTPAIHVHAHYPETGNRRLSDGASVPFTRPPGFSGGPVFRTALEDHIDFWNPESCTLIGIDQAWRESGQWIKLTRSSILFAMLKFWYPDVT